MNSSSYRVFHEEKAFILKIRKVSQEDNGDYNCSGFDVIMGNRFYSSTNLVATNPKKIRKYLFEYIFFTLMLENR